jgi:AhpD family alkylhydroperoxidase
MQPRIQYDDAAHRGALQAMYGLEKYVRGSGLEHSLLHLVKIRASQINGCAFCLDMHTKDARIQGETEQRLHTLIAWRETPFFSERERAALEWTETLTRIAGNDVPDELYQCVQQHFSEEEIVALTLAVVAINGWNRIAISFRTVPGSYEPEALAVSR